MILSCVAGNHGCCVMVCIDGYCVVLDLVHEVEACSISSPLQALPFQMLNHGRDTACHTMISLEGESCCLPLYYLDLGYILI